MHVLLQILGMAPTNPSAAPAGLPTESDDPGGFTDLFAEPSGEATSGDVEEHLLPDTRSGMRMPEMTAFPNTLELPSSKNSADAEAEVATAPLVGTTAPAPNQTDLGMTDIEVSAQTPIISDAGEIEPEHTHRPQGLKGDTEPAPVLDPKQITATSADANEGQILLPQTAAVNAAADEAAPKPDRLGTAAVPPENAPPTAPMPKIVQAPHQQSKAATSPDVSQRAEAAAEAEPTEGDPPPIKRTDSAPAEARELQPRTAASPIASAIAPNVADTPDTPAPPIPSDPVVETNTWRTDPTSRATAAPAAPIAHTQLAAEIVRLAADGQVRTAELRLDPPELGRLTVTLSFTEDGLSALIAAERNETMDLLRRNAEHLARELSAAGFEGADLQFSDQSAGSDQTTPDREETGTFASVTTDAEPTPLQRQPASGLDLRV
ncbi:flagellar hook-length control protein FliK [Pontivivens ytuae]|uniref:Flagellar hook-length control protein FliK n=1 Tax=Pontivivens ytuae TaxID=2789856 RepID=A0A7S9QCG4_9RHOB|nr:flagellar hook-length control protein FliK [Pontivivens ytuae]QPH53076.1 flagellar hook-length control protein FliK [Pontivivens ytuae]